MQIKIGLSKKNPGWNTILEQEGFSYEIIEEKNQKVTEYQIIIPDRTYLKKHRNDILKNISPQIILVDKETWPVLVNSKSNTKKVSFLKPEQTSIFNSLEIIDFYTTFLIPEQQNLESLDASLHIFYVKTEYGRVVILPFSVNELMTDFSSKRKRFHAQRKELPSEVVSSVSKGKIRELISRIIQFSFSMITLPNVRKGYYPQHVDNLFIFRVDTDFCNGKEAIELYDLCRQYDIRATWFVDTQNEHMISEVYSKLIDHEIALHCDRHRVYETYKDNQENIKHALDVLGKYDLHPQGAAAPFGEWNRSLGKVYETYGFEYSSEFALDYDDLPLFPFYDGHDSNVLEIPIHPVSIGRLRRSHFSEEEMIAYYMMIIEYRFSRNQPVILYHHPHHKKLNVWEQIFKKMSTLDVWNPTMVEFSSWWKKRAEVSYTVDFSENTICVSSDHPHITYRILDADKGYANIDANTNYDIENISFVNHEPCIFHENERMRRFCWRDMLYNLEQKRAKKRS